MINTLQCTPSEAIDVILTYLDQHKSIYLSGRPGVGKSQIVYEVAKIRNAKVIDERLSQRTAADLGGLPALDHETKRTVFYPPAFLPDINGETFLFLDELNVADEAVQAAALGLVLERRIGEYILPPNCHIIAAGNRPEDGAPQFMPALNDRFIHLCVEPSDKDWLAWAAENDIHPSVMAFIHVNPQYLVPTPEMIREDHAITPSPRSWERVSDILKVPAKRRTREIAITGIVGDAVAIPFFLMADELASMTSVKQILATKPDDLHTVVPNTLNGLYALAYALVSTCDTETASPILYLIDHLPKLGASESHRGLPLADIQALTATLIIEKMLTLGIDCTQHPAYMVYNNQREAEIAASDPASKPAQENAPQAEPIPA